MSVWLTSCFLFFISREGNLQRSWIWRDHSKNDKRCSGFVHFFFRSLSVVIFLVFVLTPLIGNLAELYDNFSKSRLFPTIVFAFLLVRLVQVTCYLIFRFKSVD